LLYKRKSFQEVFMNWNQKSKQILAGLSFALFVVTGTYNAVVINSESSISGSDVRFAKRLDEVYGVVKSGREVAASIKWQKLSVKQISSLKPQFLPQPSIVTKPIKTESDSVEVAQAAVQEELNLNLTEVINPKKWQQGINNSQFSGNLVTNNGVIESLNVSLPNDEGVSVSFSEMTGNVFEYDFNGDLYSGMMYQVDQNAYMVTLTNGPLEGTRMKFSADLPQPEDVVPQELAQNEAPVEQSPETIFQSEIQNNPEQDLNSQEEGLAEQQQAGYNFELQQST